MNYAIIDNGIVTNIICLLPANASEFSNAVPLHDRPVAIGDAYTDGRFYRDEELVLSNSERELLAETQEALNIAMGVTP